ncbi:MAG: class I SAM-dependent methyltransferase [Planctomycetota bacterium]|jgi:2-polyprenyl-3-methyl-5-hydroxy-6-metoxy-1,4-benzoquinol methylase|nr:class I SAM-dependent methyltransferase [Planctomycetota bacterium]MDP6520287.1 class I SAM-dependent methyltransferase [Planctomycetota bacterium]
MELTPEIERAHARAQDRLGQLDNYHAWILRCFGDAYGQRIWDAGAGAGLTVEHLRRNASFVLATEYTAANVQLLEKRFAADTERIQIAPCDLAGDEGLAFADHKLDTIVHLDVLEHLTDDRHALALFHSVLAPGGRLLVKVPAHPFLFGTLDRASLHHRRYTRADLREKLESAGFRIELLRSMNIAATLPYFIKGRILKREVNFSNTLSPKRLGTYNRLIPWLERLERWAPPPFGLSLVAVGRKPL